MTDRELMQQALNALEWNLPVLEDYGGKEQLKRQHKAITALRDKLAQTELVIDCPRCGHCCPQQTWVGLTDEEIKSLPSWWPSYNDQRVLLVLIRDIQAKLKEKNT